MRKTAAEHISRRGRRVKRLLDVLISAILMVPALPLILLLGLLVMLDTRGPAFYVSERLGRHGRIFRMYKLRTMQHQPAGATGLPLTHAGDPRMTRIGRLLRPLKLDELPQVFNVVKGDMSLVGPRPEDPFFLPYLGGQAEVLLSCRPGITGPASLRFSNEEALLAQGNAIEHYIDVILPQKTALDLEYIRDWSLGRDARILAATLAMPVRRRKRKNASYQLFKVDKSERI